MPEPPPGAPAPATLPAWGYAASRTGTVYYKRDIQSDLAWERRGVWNASLGDPAEVGRSASDIRRLAVNPTNTDRLYLTTDDKFARSIDGGRTWTVVDGSGSFRLPTDIIALCAHPTDGQTLYVSSRSRGVLVTYDEGATWRPFKANLPTVNVEWLESRDGFLYASTYGRGLWRRRLA